MTAPMPDPTPQTVARVGIAVAQRSMSPPHDWFSPPVRYSADDDGRTCVITVNDAVRVTVDYAALAAAVQRETLAAVREKVEGEQLTDETDHPMDRGYNCAIKDALAQIDLYLATLAEPPR